MALRRIHKQVDDLEKYAVQKQALLVRTDNALQEKEREIEELKENESIGAVYDRATVRLKEFHQKQLEDLRERAAQECGDQASMDRIRNLPLVKE